MYGKIFKSIYDGTLSEDWRALITFQQFIILADRDGMVDMTPRAIARHTGIPIEHIEAGIKVLEEPDQYSRTPDESGKRIELIDSHRDWGWHIINYEKYRDTRDMETVREQTRERVRRHRKKKELIEQGFTEEEAIKAVTNSNDCNAPVTHGNAQKRHIDTDKDSDSDLKKQKRASPFKPPSHVEVQMYCQEKGYNIDAENFCDFYEAKGWMIGKNKMKDWKAAVRNWVKRQGNSYGNQQQDSKAKRHFDKIADIARNGYE